MLNGAPLFLYINHWLIESIWVYQPTVWSQNLNTRNIYIDSMFILYTLYISSKKNLENHVERMIYFCLVKSS